MNLHSHNIVNPGLFILGIVIFLQIISLRSNSTIKKEALPDNSGTTRIGYTKSYYFCLLSYSILALLVGGMALSCLRFPEQTIIKLILGILFVSTGIYILIAGTFINWIEWDKERISVSSFILGLRSANWSDITCAQSKPWLGFLTLSTNNGNILWIPQFVSGLNLRPLTHELDSRCLSGYSEKYKQMRQNIVEMLNSIRATFPHLHMEINRSPEVCVDLTMEIVKQPGLDFDIHIDMQNDELHLGIKNFWCEWFPCSDEERIDEFKKVVCGIISGTYRIRETYRGNKCIKSQIQSPHNDDWETVASSFHTVLSTPWDKPLRTSIFQNQDLTL